MTFFVKEVGAWIYKCAKPSKKRCRNDIGKPQENEE